MNALRKTVLLAGLGPKFLCPSTAFAAVDDDMKALASKSGCLTCHAIESGTLAPTALRRSELAWQDVAKMYQRRVPTPFLTLGGAGGLQPPQGHRKNQVSGLAMPPNKHRGSWLVIAKKLVKWILTLAPARATRGRSREGCAVRKAPVNPDVLLLWVPCLRPLRPEPAVSAEPGGVYPCNGQAAIRPEWRWR